MNSTNLINDVESSLLSLEEQRQELWSGFKSSTVKFVLLPVAVVFVFIIVINRSQGFMVFAKDFVFFALILLSLMYSIFVLLRLYNQRSSKFKHQYKKVLVEPLMIKIFPELTYRPDSYIKEHIFRESGLFSNNFNSYKGDDYFFGEINGIPIEFSELTVIDSNSNTGSRSSNRDQLFSGIFLHAEIKRSVENRIVVDPKLFDNIPLPNFIKSIIKRFLPDYGPVVETGIKEFDDNYKLHSENASEAKQILKPELIEKILKVSDILIEINKKKYPKTVDMEQIQNRAMLKISVVGNSMYFALFGTKLFDVKFNKSTMKGKDDLTQSLQFINMMVEIAKSL